VFVRPETDRDLDGIREVNLVAFQGHPYSQQTEHLIVAALRAADALEVSLVAESDGEVVGHVAFSAAAIGRSSTGWFLLGPAGVFWSEIQPSTAVSGSGSIRAWPGTTCRTRTCSAS
jgi:putative acetyltransferase